MQLDKAAENFVLSIRYHRMIAERALTTMAQVRKKLRECGDAKAPRERLLKAQIQMRVLGCGWHE